MSLFILNLCDSSTQSYQGLALYFMAPLYSSNFDILSAILLTAVVDSLNGTPLGAGNLSYLTACEVK